ncbi:hypothetical protein ILUMI_00840 [Ignelater luminosus]|uniref:Reverse transcriptase domain-containing protein n=1 Tax=Ignelater luminosus TaxID=2038154 RepID=A0A8K0GPU0_IGNLU|nr:hypothetical protein ILUMI_00840 [Ignelater luminosus]
MMIKLETKPKDTTIIQAYMPTTDHDDEHYLEKLYDGDNNENFPGIKDQTEVEVDEEGDGILKPELDKAIQDVVKWLDEKTTNKRKPYWWDEDIEIDIEGKSKAFQKYLSTKCTEDKIRYKEAQGKARKKMWNWKSTETREAILGPRLITEKMIRKDKRTYITFTDIEKAFDNFEWKRMFQILQMGVKYKDRRIILNSYQDQLAVIKYREQQTDAKIRKSVRQECSLSPPFGHYV